MLNRVTLAPVTNNPKISVGSHNKVILCSYHSPMWRVCVSVYVGVCASVCASVYVGLGNSTLCSLLGTQILHLVAPLSVGPLSPLLGFCI